MGHSSCPAPPDCKTWEWLQLQSAATFSQPGCSWPSLAPAVPSPAGPCQFPAPSWSSFLSRILSRGHREKGAVGTASHFCHASGAAQQQPAPPKLQRQLLEFPCLSDGPGIWAWRRAGPGGAMTGKGVQTWAPGLAGCAGRREARPGGCRPKEQPGPGVQGQTRDKSRSGLG